MNDVIKSLRNLFLVSLAVMLLWFVTWPAAIEKLTLFEQLRYVHAWLVLKETIEKLELDPFETDTSTFESGEPITFVLRDECDPRSRGDCREVEAPIEAKTTWPVIATNRLTLVPANFYVRQEFPKVLDFVRFYRVHTGASELPLAPYYVVYESSGGGAPRYRIVPEGTESFIKKNAVGLRSLYATTKELNQPKFWNAIQPSLTKHGYTDTLPGKLVRADKALAALQLESDPRLTSGGVQVFGLKISIGVFFAAVGIFLAAVAFATLGPVIKLRSLHRQSTRREREWQHWILALEGSTGLARQGLEVTISLVSLIWGLAPLAILVLQLTADVDLTGVNEWGLPVGALGLAFSSMVFLWAARELRKYRIGGVAKEFEREDT